MIETITLLSLTILGLVGYIQFKQSKKINKLKKDSVKINKEIKALQIKKSKNKKISKKK